MIEPQQVEGYESNDSDYAAALWDYTRRTLKADEVVDIVAQHPSESGIEALEQHHWEQLEYTMPDARPPSASIRGYINTVLHLMEEMPERLALKFWKSELAVWDGWRTTEKELFAEIELLCLAEDYFEVDLTDEVVDAAKALPESQSKLDTLDRRGVIDGDEWYERHEELEA